MKYILTDQNIEFFHKEPPLSAMIIEKQWQRKRKTEWNDKINPIIRETGCFALRISRVEAASEDTDRL